MAQTSFSVLYGPTGSPRLSSRFSIEGQPFEGVPLFVGGTISNRPAHLIGLSGSAYRYGGTSVLGAKNLLPVDNGSALVSTPPYAGNLGANAYDLGVVAGTNSPFHVPLQTLNARYLYQTSATLMADGEVVGSAGPAGFETFTTAGTVTVTNGNSTITGSGSSWTSNTLSATYAYTPANNAIQRGDVIKVTHPVSGTVYYRIKSVTDNTHLVVFPTPAEQTASGCAYSIYRTGYGSYSRVIPIRQANGTIWFYYAGLNYPSPYPLYPTLMAFNASNSPTHLMGPTGVQAADIAYYKSYLVYAYSRTIGWSVPGFPTTFPFASADLPAASVSVQTTGGDDTFVSFEYLGDQLIALFKRSIYVVQQNPGQTQSSAFSFYRLPANIGCLGEQVNRFYADVPTTWFGDDVSIFRPSCSADGAVYFMGPDGLMEFTGTNAKPVSEDVADILPHAATLHWDHVTDSIIVNQFSDPMFLYHRPTQGWYPQSWKKAFGTSDNTSSADEKSRSPRWVYYDGTNIDSMLVTGTTSVLDRPYADPTDSWAWASPIANVGDRYANFSLGGIRIDCEAPSLTTANVTVTIYGGKSPYVLNNRGAFTYNAAVGTVSGKDLVGGKVDDPFLGVTLSGSTRIKLIGVWIYPSQTAASR